MSVFVANLLSALLRLELSSLIAFLEDIDDQKSSFVEKNDFQRIKFLCEKRDGHSKRERMEIIDLYLKHFFAG